MFGAAPANWYGLSKLMEIACEKAGTKPGELITISASAHIYESDWKEVEKIIGHYPMNLNAEKGKFIMDPKGYFLIRIDKKRYKIVLEHYNNQHELLYRIAGKTAEEISHELATHTRGLRPEHYLYLGRELMKAEMALKLNIEYRQDSPLNF